MTELSHLRERFGERLLEAPERRAPYEIPERGAPGRAAAVLVPRDAGEVQAALETANQDALHYVLCAGRTGLVEAQRPDGEIVLSLERLKRVLRVELAGGASCDLSAAADADAARDRLFAWWSERGRPATEGLVVEAEAGVAVDTLNGILAPLGRMFPMEMGSTATASVGACVSNASAGANAVCYGTAAHMADAAFGFWGRGADAGTSRSEPWSRPAPTTLAIDSTRLPEAWGLIGTQGVFGVVTRVRLKTHAIPAQREGAMVVVGDMAEAMALFERARAEFGADIEEYEFLSRSSLGLVVKHRGADVRLPFESLPDAPYAVLLQVKSEDRDADLSQRLYEFMSGRAGLPDEAIGYAPLPALKKIRHSVTESSNLEMRALGGGRLSFDTATPVAVFGEYLDRLARELAAARPDVQLVAFGHAGVGGAHLHLIGGAGAPVAPDAARLTTLVFDVTQACGGTYSAEHGVGPKWADEFLRRTPKERLARLAARKRECDPKNVVQPRSFGFDRMLRA
ncbi:MAG TPA: FAD-binding oxidoreductase [Candidatus Limnocylindria bacterium]|nr:FAD-binding oxidoreductase [Candidatus Limnocylindria bacterium]